jgi:hypothetical protein
MKNGERRLNTTTWTPEMYVVDRWLSLEALLDCTVIHKQCLTDILREEFGDRWQEAMTIVKQFNY